VQRADGNGDGTSGGGGRVVVPAPQLLELEQQGPDNFRSVRNLDNGVGALFGGQPMLQALRAAQLTTEAWPAHSMNAAFLRSGKVDEAVDYAVERVRDGRRFASRRVLASQGGKPIFDMLCSFHDPEDGPVHQFGETGELPAPETLLSVDAFVTANAHRLKPDVVRTFTIDFPVDLRLTDPEQTFFERPGSPERSYWFRLPAGGSVEDPLAQQCLLAFMSDFWFAGTAGILHFDPGDRLFLSVVTLNHSMWFHAPPRTGEWMLFRTESPWTGQGRGFVRGQIFDRGGALVADAVQEVSIRNR
jgi:acyl-CoA thioesterase-2